jgi:FG-GAP-like repeat
LIPNFYRSAFILPLIKGYLSVLNSFRRLFSNPQNRKARRVFGSPRLELLSLEQRINPAAFTYNGSNALTIDLDTMNEVLTLTSQGNGAYVFTSTSNFTGTNTTGFTGTGTTTLTITSALNLTDVVITDSVAGTDVSFGANTGAYEDNFSITLNEAGASVVTVANATAFTGTAGLNVAAARNIEITADLSTVTGNIVLDADNSVQQTGNFVGVNISGSGVEVTTTGGNITIAGRGGDDSNNNQFGVYVQNGAQVQAGNNGSIFGTVSVTGTGGAAGGDFNYGVNVDGANSKITSSGGSVTIIGNGGGTGATGGGTAATSDNNRGVEVYNGGEISAGGTGTVSVTGTGGAAGGEFNYGVNVDGANSIITSSGGSVTVIGNGGGTSVSGNNRGVRVFNGGKISAGLMGNVSVTGTGGATGGDDNYGVNVVGANSIITSSGGSVTIIGNGGGTGATSDSNRGLVVDNGGEISAGGTGIVSVTGTGGAAGGLFNYGLFVVNTGSKITSSGGSVTVIGNGGGTGATSDTNRGVEVNGGEISAGLMGTVSVTGTGGAAGGGFNHGVNVDGANSIITSSGGSVTIIGIGGGTGSSPSNRGININLGGKISAGGTGTVSVTGTGGATGGSFNMGVRVQSTGSIITSSGGDVTVTGTGGGTGALSSSNLGIYIFTGGKISAGGTGTVSVTGTGGVGVSTGIELLTSAATITTNSSGAAITLSADSMAFDATSVVSSTGTVTLQNKTAGVAIDLGTETTGQLSLTDTELDRVTAGTLVIGRSGVNPGVITVSNALTLPSTVSALQLIGPAGITLNNNVTTTGSQTYTGAVTLGANTTLNAGSGNILLPGTISNFGAGTFSLTPITSGAGLTTISGVNTAEVKLTSGVVTIANPSDQTGGYRVSGGTLQGGSMAKVGYINTDTGPSNLAPGINGPGMMHTNFLFLSSGNTVQIDLQGTTAVTGYDQIVVCVPGNNAYLNGATLALTSTFTPASGTVFTIIDNQDNTFPIDGTFNGLAEGAIITANGKDYQISYVGGTGNDVTLTVVAPTPTPTPTPTAPLITGTPTPPSSSGASTVNLYDAVTGQPTGTAVPFPGYEGPVKVASGDFNNDGVAELVAGAGFGGGPAIAILNSQTGEVMEAFFAFDQAFTGGVFVAVQDVNNDGILDIIASAGPGGGPEVRIFNGANLTVLRSFFAYAEDFTGGVSVASIDFNNDGILDLVTGAGPGGAPHVKVYDGATNAIISQWYAYPASFTGGVFVAVGDIGNDGTFEVVTGAGPGGAPVVAVWDPFTGTLLSQFYAYAEDFTGGARVAINDGNGDGVPDILTGAGPGGGPHVKAFSFPALDLLFEFYSGESTDPGGVFVS